MNERRIGALDGFRTIAITLVIFFHYYCRFTPPKEDYYPYHDAYKNWFFMHGDLGVQLFFIISGFVIYFSIIKSKTFKEFILKRLIRLMPPLILASILTFSLVRYLDPSQQFAFFHVDPISFLPSLTFIDPGFLNIVLPGKNIQLIDGVYWSLLVEVKFYIAIGVIYFVFSKEKFIRSWTIFVLLVFAIYCFITLFNSHLPSKVVLAAEILLFYHYITFFSMGIYFYDYFINGKLKWEYLVPLLFIPDFYLKHGSIALVFLLVFIGMFISLVKNYSAIKIFDTGLLKRIGVMSYTIYLLHQDLGIILINKVCNWIPWTSVWPFVPILVYLFFIGIAEVIYRTFELPSKKLLTNLFFKKKTAPSEVAALREYDSVKS